jgi:anti-sigma factor RsiW
MRCSKVRKEIEELREAEVPARFREHLAACAACAAYAKDWRLVQAGLRALAQEPVPEAAPGFAARVVRRWEALREASPKGEEFWEQAGRRFVYATLLLTVTTLLALFLPATGPLGAPTAAEVYFAGPEVAAVNDPLFADESSGDLVPADQRPAEGSSTPP